MKNTNSLISILCAGIVAVSAFATVASADNALTINSTSPTAVTASAKTPAKVSVKTAYSCTTNAIRINWNKVSGATGYRIYRYNGSNWVNLGTIKNGNTLTYRDGKCESGTLYQYKVKAYKKVNGTNYWGSASNIKYASTKSKAVTITSTSKTYDAVRLNWTKQTGNGYQVYQLKGSTWKKIETVRNMNTTTLRISGLSPSTTYQFKVRAYRTDTKGVANGGTCGYATVKTSANPNAFKTQAREILDLVNAERAKVGASALTLDANLCKAANTRAKEIINVFDHKRPDGRNCFTVLSDMGISYGWAGENIAMGQTTSAKVMDSWMNSPGHKSNILSTNFTKLGVGYDSSANAWVQIFTS